MRGTGGKNAGEKRKRKSKEIMMTNEKDPVRVFFLNLLRNIYILLFPIKTPALIVK